MQVEDDTYVRDRGNWEEAGGVTETEVGADGRIRGD